MMQVGFGLTTHINIPINKYTKFLRIHSKKSDNTLPLPVNNIIKIYP